MNKNQVQEQINAFANKFGVEINWMPIIGTSEIADVSINIFAHILAQQYAQDVEISCSIGDTFVNATIGKQKMTFKYSDIVKEAKKYIDNIGGFEKFAAWGLIRPQHNPIEYYPTNLVGQC